MGRILELVAYSLTVSFPLVLVTDNLYLQFPEVLFPASQLPPSPGYSYFVPGTFLRAKFILYGQFLKLTADLFLERSVLSEGFLITDN